MNKIILGLSAAALCLGYQLLPAQEPGATSAQLEQLWEEWLENRTGEDTESLYESLADLLENPLDLNHADKDELLRLPFLDDHQKEALRLYLDRHRPLASLSELLLIDGWDEWTLKAVRPLVRIETDKDRQGRLAIGRHHQSLRLRTDRVLQKKRGYQAEDSLRELSKSYLGSPQSLSLVWNYRKGQHFQAGIALEKDAGETGADFFSWHIHLKKAGCLSDLVLGDYHVTMGQGLICNPGSFGGKSAAAATLAATGAILRPHRSTSEYGYLRGIGLQTELGRHWRLTGFCSQRRIDTRRQDSVFSSLVTGGLHRTVRERENRGNTELIQYGGQLCHSLVSGQWSLNALYYRFDIPWQTDGQAYRQFQFQGREGANLSIDARLRYHQLFWGSELACDAQGRLSGLATLTIQAHPLLKSLVCYRHYDIGYQAPFASSFGVNGSAANEEGLFAWVDCRLVKAWDLTAYLDCYRFPWLKYQVNAPSKGYELMAEGRYGAGRKTEILLRYKERSGPYQLPASQCGPGVAPILSRRRCQGRLQISLSSDCWRYRTTLDLHWQKDLQSLSSVSQGTVVCQEIRFSTDKRPFSLCLQHCLFDTGGLVISSYQADLAGSMPFASLSGQGCRNTLLVSLRLRSRWQLDLRLRHTRYSDRESIGSSLESIEGCRQTQLGAVVKLKM